MGDAGGCVHGWPWGQCTLCPVPAAPPEPSPTITLPACKHGEPEDYCEECREERWAADDAEVSRKLYESATVYKMITPERLAELEAAEARVRELEAKLDDEMSAACIDADPDCGCAGCEYARQRAAKEASDG